MKLIEETKKDKNLFEALYDAFKWANRANEKLLRVEAIIDGSATVLHYSLEEETAELRSLVKKASKKILYLNFLLGERMLSRRYSSDERMDLIFDFIDMVNDEIEEIEEIIKIA